MVNDINPALLSSSGSSSRGTNESYSKFLDDSNDFLTMFLEMLKHQDPLNPLKGTDFMEGIATFSGVEQSVKQTSYLKEMVNLERNNNSALESTVEYLGKEVEFYSDRINLEKEKASFAYYINPEDSSVTDVSIIITDLEGKTVFSSNVPKSKLGRNEVTWDGTDKDGKALSEGHYKIQVFGGISDEENVQLPTVTRGMVVESSIENNKSILATGSGIKLPVENIRLVKMK